jgi:hypothetical protein
MPKYEVKNVKGFTGMEGYGYECTLYKDEARIGTITDPAEGGEPHFFLNQGEKELLDQFCKTLPKTPLDSDDLDVLKEKYPDGMDVDASTFIARLVDEYEGLKQLKKWCKKETLFTLEGDKKGHYRTVKLPYSPLVKQRLEQKYLNQGLKIVNETL